MNDTETILKQISGILLRSFIMAMALLTLWLLAYFVAGDYWFATHTNMFNLTAQDLSVLTYAGFGLFKLLAVCFLLCPYIAIQTVIRFK
jgi:hypothetical protein